MISDEATVIVGTQLPAARPATAPGMHRVRIITPPQPRAQMLAQAYGLEIDGHPIYPHTTEMRFEPGCTPLVTITLSAIVENAEILAELHTGALTLDQSEHQDEQDEPPFPREEC